MPDTTVATEDDQDGEGLLCLINGQLLVPTPPSLKDMDRLFTPSLMGGPHREDNEGVGYVANESGAQIIRDMAHLKKSNCTMNENIMELLSWKADSRLFPKDV